MDGRIWRNPIFIRILLKYPNFTSEKYGETQVLTWYRKIINLQGSLLLKIYLSTHCLCMYTNNISTTNASLAVSRETFKYNMTHGKVSPYFAKCSASIIQFDA